MRKFGGVIERSGKHIGRYKVNGKTYYTRAFPTRREAEKELRIINGEILAGIWQADPSQLNEEGLRGDLEGKTFKDAAEIVLETLREAKASPNTLRSSRSMLKAYAYPKLENKLITKLSRADIEAIEAELMKSGKAPLTVESVSSRLRSLLKNMVKLGYIKADVIPPKLPALVGARENTVHKPITLTSEELTKVVDLTPEHTRFAFALMSWCALRYSEAAVLTKADIKTNPPRVRVDKAIKRGEKGGLTIGSPKNRGSYREIAIPSKLYEMMETHLRDFAGENLLFESESHPLGFYRDSVLRAQLHKALKELGLPLMRLHDLRHTGLTLYGQTGATLADLMYRAGHSDVGSVKIYQHSSATRDRQLADLM